MAAIRSLLPRASTLIPSIRAAGPSSSKIAGPSTTARYQYRYNSTSTSSSTRPSRPCPSCSAPLPITSSPCPSCSKIVNIPHGLSHHSMLHLSDPIASASASTSSSSSTVKAAFDLPAELSTLPAYGFDLVVKDIRNKMLRRQMELHPDKYSGDEKEVTLARELSGRINGAYEILRDPLKRAEYLLSTQELEVAETESLTDPMLLAEILEAREELEEASSAEEVDTIRQTNEAKVQETIAALRDAFAQDPPNLSEAKGLSVQLKYWQGLENAAKEWTPQ